MSKPYFIQGDRNRVTSDERMVQLDELDEWQINVEEQSRKYNEETKQLHDVHVRRLSLFKVGDKVLLEKLEPRMFPSELKSRGSNPFVVLNIFPYGTIEVAHYEFNTFKVNSTCLKRYFGSKTDNEREKLQLQDPS
ncbi:uncharacterized protein LOC108487669 [Gossypium arboreum]|uniref:uncharacterized protein LOC108487669 n=1 Tax=Gossypium arboreum TaxID=29729 RepID=UPI0008190324|nr:uncharacterized protein LOC108487669 [Gossypium arboreum]